VIGTLESLARRGQLLVHRRQRVVVGRLEHGNLAEQHVQQVPDLENAGWTA